MRDAASAGARVPLCGSSTVWQDSDREDDEELGVRVKFRKGRESNERKFTQEAVRGVPLTS